MHTWRFQINTRALNSKFPNLEAYFCFWVGDTTFSITYLESWLKDDSEYISEYFLRCSRVWSFWEAIRKKVLISQTKKSTTPWCCKSWKYLEICFENLGYWLPYLPKNLGFSTDKIKYKIFFFNLPLTLRTCF